MGTTDRDKYNYHDHLNLFLLRSITEKKSQKWQGDEGEGFLHGVEVMEVYFGTG